jgi:hypothetical protein
MSGCVFWSNSQRWFISVQYEGLPNQNLAEYTRLDTEMGRDDQTDKNKTVSRKTNLMHNLFLAYFVNLYVFRVYLGPSSGDTTVCI